MQPKLDAALFFAYETLDGYSLTLVSRLGEMLRLAEEMYGRRDNEYTILGIEFSSDGPKICYPGNCKNVAIQLGRSAMTDNDQACYQLAHECIHLLSPNGKNGASNLEEGLATYNSAYYMKNEMRQANWQASLPSYVKVEKLVRKIMDADPQAIKRMRQSELTISKITAELLQKESQVLNADEAKFLADKFVRSFSYKL